MDEKQLAAIDRLLPTVEKPARYIGGEMNTSIKPRKKETAAFAFCFPDSYEVAMSHLGMKILYHILNKQPDMLCERVMMPWVDMMGHMRREDIPLFSLESRTALRDFDIVGFTLQYHLATRYMRGGDFQAIAGSGGPSMQGSANLTSVVVAAGSPHIGKTLGVRLRMTGGHWSAMTVFDNVRLTAVESDEWKRSLFYGK